ncbi:MAG TPA: hypothetical protein VFF52_31110, partial [Isosphaeraceae bacterium]|nr:hypothetical protein [Isosphaeraceae bacterium]
MTDPHQIVEQIRTLLHAGDPARNGRLAALATSYAGACHEITQRLGRCHRLLQQGLRSEAIQLAESEPNLLETLAALDFPERAEWDDLVHLHDLEPAPRLPIEPARLLNEAYAEENPLQDLLRRHRRLALQRAPLRSRIAVVRQLAAQDPANAIWVDEQRAYESVRLVQIQDEATEAVRMHDAAALARLVAEVEQPGWAEPPSPALIQSLRKADADLRGERTRAVLEEVASRLDEAHNGRDSIRGRLARQEWARLAATAALARDDPIAGRVQPALDWLADEDRRVDEDRRREAAVTALVRALDYPGFLPPNELERLAHEVSRHGQSLPEGLQQRYISRLHAAEARQSRRFYLNAAAASAALLLAATLIYYVVHSQARASEAEQVATSISDMLELGEVDRAAEVLQDLQAKDPALLSYARLIEVRQRVDVARNKEAERALQFDQAMRAADAAPASASKIPALEAARSLARLDTEKAALENLEKRRAAALQAEQAREEKELGPRLAEIGRNLDRIEQQAGSVEPGGAK